MKESYVYILFHIHEDSNKNDTEEIKILGVYSSASSANEAKNRYKTLCGFDKYTEKCFVIDRYKVDIDSNFTTGFMSWMETT